MHECWLRYGETGVGMAERGLETVAREVSGLELADFFERYVRGTTELPLQHLLKEVGVELSMRSADRKSDGGGKPARNQPAPPPWIGATLAAQAGNSVFTAVHSGSPAEVAGIAPGDVAVALDNLQLDVDSLDARLREHHAGDKVTITVFRDEFLVNFRVRLGDPPQDTCYLKFAADPDARTKAMRDAWLAGTKSARPG